MISISLRPNNFTIIGHWEKHFRFGIKMGDHFFRYMVNVLGTSFGINTKSKKP